MERVACERKQVANHAFYYALIFVEEKSIFGGDFDSPDNIGGDGIIFTAAFGAIHTDNTQNVGTHKVRPLRLEIFLEDPAWDAPGAVD